MPRAAVYHDEYRVGPRTVLKPGDLFRASGGPYWEADREGTTAKESLAEKGPFRFVRYCEQGARKFIECIGQNGFCVLNVGRRYRLAHLPRYVNRPYRVRGKVGQPKR